MNDKYLISFIIPVYNVKKYLTYCLDSVVCQLDDDCEVIIVDDGSNDGGELICDEYSNRFNNIKVVHKSNGGLVSARKAGLIESSGKYIACLDSDDWIENNYVKTVKQEILNYNPDIICFNYYINDKGFDKKKIFTTNRMMNKNEIVNDIFPKLIQSEDFSYFPPAIWAKVIKRELYFDIQMSVDDRTKIGEDIACTIPCIYKANSISLIKDYLYHYRFNDLSMTKGRNIYDWDGPKYITNNLKKYINFNEGNFNEQLDRFITHQFIMISKTIFYSNKRYDIIKKEIMSKRNDLLYKKSIDNSITKGNILAYLATFFVKHNMIFPLFLYSRIG